MLDGHALACSAAAPGTVFLANRMGLFRLRQAVCETQQEWCGRRRSRLRGRAPPLMRGPGG